MVLLAFSMMILKFYHRMSKEDFILMVMISKLMILNLHVKQEQYSNNNVLQNDFIYKKLMLI